MKNIPNESIHERSEFSLDSKFNRARKNPTPSIPSDCH